VRLAVLGGCALGFAAGWNVANTGAVAQELADRYDVGLAVVGLFTTALFLTHLAMQIPAGRSSDRFGPRRTGLVGIALMVSFNVVALVAPQPALAVVARALVGVGLALAFIAGTAYVREHGGSPFAQGLFGGVAMAGAGVALATVPQVEGWLGWRAPFVTSLAVALGALLCVLVGPTDRPREPVVRRGAHAVLSDSHLYRLAVVFAASFGLSIVIGNWSVTLLDRQSGVGQAAAGAIGALTLGLGVLSRPLGGWIMRAHPRRIRSALAASLAAGALGTVILAASEVPALSVVGAAMVGLAAGIPFAPAYTGAATSRPDAPAAAVGFVNSLGIAVVVVGAPLLGLAFSLSGGGRAGFLVVAALWAAALVALPSERELGVATAASESR
jgi:MFS family permease